MKIHLFAIVILSSVLGSFAADSTITLKNVHLCCGACVKGVERSVKDIEGVTVKADEDSGMVKLTSSDKAKLQKAADAMAEGGYFGVSDKSDFKPVAKTGAKGEKVQSLTVAGAHLCCPGCVKAVDRAVKNTPGATGHTATKNAETFVVKGEFNDQQFFEALQKEGLSAKIVKSAK
ncbi:MAG: heavy-metal-associated domain-containing protein [Limisphaerales bacterium]